MYGNRRIARMSNFPEQEGRGWKCLRLPGGVADQRRISAAGAKPRPRRGYPLQSARILRQISFATTCGCIILLTASFTAVLLAYAFHAGAQNSLICSAFWRSSAVPAVNNKLAQYDDHAQYDFLAMHNNDAHRCRRTSGWHRALSRYRPSARTFEHSTRFSMRVADESSRWLLYRRQN